ncbi:Endonuclease/exonuclease/phosphatase [Lophiotrema nucula]|uniref:Endonuclease/exonuclease/phosphatase n=1 Tax=Lophiotrema nucula TaxID=690887 RepID=A0A6A5ZIT6_9PLEO|nr:Endonuclease/exonuclease/phosphatase [Lophiotrema nucula]
MADPKSKSTPILDALTAALKSGPAQECEDAFYEPRPQGYWYYGSSSWVDVKPSASEPVPPLTRLTSSLYPEVVRLISWNIDILVPFVEERMAAALQYLEELVALTEEGTPVVVFLQEMGQSDLRQIRDASWVQERFFITELDERNWLSPLYGTTTLVDRRLRIESVWRVPWVSEFDRDGLFVDIGFDGSEKVLRLCNTHLESLVADPPARPLQLEAAGKILQEESVAAALLAGDLNAIQPFDRTLHSENGLKDTYLELGGEEDSDDGYTWGQQVPQWMRDKFGCSRMDKILFRGSVLPKQFERIGINVKVAEEKRQEVRDAGEQEWVTDHYGVMGDFTLDGWKLGVRSVEDNKVSSKLA